MKAQILIIAALAAFSSALSVVKDTAQADVGYHLWFEPKMNENSYAAKLTVNAEMNQTFFEVMEKAAAADEDYRFEYIEYPFGRYITSIGGMKEEPEKNIYWFIFKVPKEPSIEDPPGNECLTPVGVDGIRVSNEDIYLFWRKEWVQELAVRMHH